jgi:branched-chain amino acid transport system substrate-binding protein
MSLKLFEMESQKFITNNNMSKQNKILAWVVAVIVVVGAVYTITTNKTSKNNEQETITIGYVGPLSGDGASIGETERNATQLGVDEINASGGIGGKKLKIIYEDGKCTGKDATSALQKLINIDKVSIVLGGTCSAESLAMVPIATQNKVLMLSGFSSNPQLTGISPWFFRNSPKDTDVAKLDAETIVAKYKKVAIISENTDYPLGVRDVMKQIFDEKGVSVVFDEIYNSSQSDFKTLFIKIKNSDADVIYINPGSSAKSAGIMVKQIRELGIKIPIHGNFSLGTPDALEMGGKYMEGVIASDGSDLSKKGKEVLKKYIAQFGKQPINEYLVGSAYDRPFIIRDAIISNGLDIEKIVEYLNGMKNFSGAIGTYHFDEKGDVIGVGFINVIIKDGKKVPLE